MNKVATQSKSEVMPLSEQAAQLPAIQQTEAGALMTIIERISTMPELDLDHVERLFAMHQQALARTAEQQFNEAMAITQGELQPVVARKTNSHTKSVYADIDAVHESAKPIWTKNGFSVVSRTAPSPIQNHIKIICEVRHGGGHKEVYEDDWPLDTTGAKGGENKTAIQGKGSTTTYARRYTELMIFDIAIKRLDKDGNAPLELSQKAADWIAAIDATGSLTELQNTYKDAFRDLQAAKDNYGLNQINKAKDAKKRAFQ